VSALAAAAGRGIRIVHLEDDPLDATLVEEAIRADGLDGRVLRVEDRRGFLEALARGVDIILSDYNLPAYDGFAALADARQAAPDAPFVFVSGTLGEERAVDTLKAGATDYVLKEHLNRLGPAMRRALSEAAERRARREAEAALEDSRRFVERVIEATPEIVYVFDPQSGRTIYLNQRIHEVLGHSPEELAAMGSAILGRIVHPDDMPRLRAAIEGLGEAGASGVVEADYRVRDAAGGWRWLSTRSVRFRSPHGAPQILGTAQDVTERRAAQRALRDSEEKFRSIVETTSEWIWEVDASFVHVYSNPAVRKMLGYEPSEIVGRSSLSLLHPADREAMETELEGFAFQKRGWEGLVLRWIHRDGSTRYLESTAVPVLDEDGALVGYRGSDRDITARMEAEEKLREQAMLLENAVEATLLTDPEGRIRFWNRGAASLYEWSPEEAVGRNVAEMFASEAAVSAREARRHVEEFGSWSGLVHQRTRSGRDVIVQSRWSPIRGSDGRLRSILILNSDVTEAQRLEARFLRAQRMEGIGTLAGGIAHDLNNVLAPILMSIEVLQRKVADPHGQRMLGILETSARRGADLVKQVLTFSRGAQGPAGLLDPAHILREMERMARETFPKSIRVQSDVAPGLWQVVGQATPLQQVLMNLCVNARDAMPSGGTLTLRAWNETARGGEEGRPAPHVVLEVADTGTGIAPEILERIFDPFFTTKPVGLGTGLGLSTTAAIVKSHGGFIDVDTALDRGTAFRVFRPARLGAEAPAPPVEARVEPGRGELVLVIDDEAAILGIARETLESFGYTVLTAASGEAAIEAFRERKGEVRLVITDMSMPGLGGAAAIRQLHAIDPSVPIVASSGREMETMEGAPATGFLPKPYSGRALLEAVQAALGAAPR
jgi:PAS domain S-box-containing protein